MSRIKPGLYFCRMPLPHSIHLKNVKTFKLFLLPRAVFYCTSMNSFPIIVVWNRLVLAQPPPLRGEKNLQVLEKIFQGLEKFFRVWGIFFCPLHGQGTGGHTHTHTHTQENFQKLIFFFALQGEFFFPLTEQVRRAGVDLFTAKR